MSGIDPTVRACWCAFTERFEGRIPWLYLDAHKPDPIATVGLGCALLTVHMSSGLPWLYPDGTPAGEGDIIADWQRVTAIPGGLVAWHYRSAEGLHLDDSTIDALALTRLDADVVALTSRWPEFASFPAPAQQALASMAYALGVGARPPGLLSPEWPRLQASVDAQNWLQSAFECRMEGPGLEGRNAANLALFGDASAAA